MPHVAENNTELRHYLAGPTLTKEDIDLLAATKTAQIGAGIELNELIKRLDKKNVKTCERNAAKAREQKIAKAREQKIAKAEEEKAAKLQAARAREEKAAKAREQKIAKEQEKRSAQPQEKRAAAKPQSNRCPLDKPPSSATRRRSERFVSLPSGLTLSRSDLAETKRRASSQFGCGPNFLAGTSARYGKDRQASSSGKPPANTDTARRASGATSRRTSKSNKSNRGVSSAALCLC
ncbi:hypothetical protein E4U21_002783 [Claviceps maximensis]|nr:hypothetical protein E4U21_002783 [Claviceps maximensis]